MGIFDFFTVLAIAWPPPLLILSKVTTFLNFKVASLVSAIRNWKGSICCYVDCEIRFTTLWQLYTASMLPFSTCSISPYNEILENKENNTLLNFKEELIWKQINITMLSINVYKWAFNQLKRNSFWNFGNKKRLLFLKRKQKPILRTEIYIIKSHLFKLIYNMIIYLLFSKLRKVGLFHLMWYND